MSKGRFERYLNYFGCSTGSRTVARTSEAGMRVNVQRSRMPYSLVRSAGSTETG